MAFGYYRPITIDHTQAGSVDTSDWPMLFSFTNVDFKTTGHGGLIQNSSGFDLCFSSDLAGSGLLSWEMQSYDPVNGVVLAWVKVPTLSHTGDTTIYVQYGDATISTFQGGSLGAAWNANYWQVYHLGESAHPYKDSTSNALDSVSTNDPTQVSGNGTLGKAQSFVAGSSQNIKVANKGLSPTPSSISGWMLVPNAQATDAYMVDTRDNTSNCGSVIYVNSADSMRATGYYNNNGPHGAGPNMGDGVWHHYALINQGGTGTFQLYKDGVSVFSVTGGTEANVTIGNADLGSIEWAGLHSTETIQEIRMSNVDLTGQLLADYNSQIPSQTMVALGAQQVHSGTPYIPPPFSMIPYIAQ